MKATDYGPKNPLRCPTCDSYRYLRIKGYQFKRKDEKAGVGIKIPFYDCDNCITSSPMALDEEMLLDGDAQNFYQDRADEILPELDEGQFVSLKTPFQDKKFDIYNAIGFVFDSQDYYYIPGLYRSNDEGFLCPVFFSIELLLYYNNHNEYRVVFSSYSRLQIFDSSNNNLISHGFGINREGLIICWLGDLYEELNKKKNEKHKKIFLAFNEPSNHDIVSDYYFNQIEANFMEPDNEALLFQLRNEFDQLILEKEQLNITHIDLKSVINEYKHPILNESDQINSSYIKLNSILIESLSIENLKKIILKSGLTSKEIKELKGLKLFEKLIIGYAGPENGSKIVSPLFVLYDLRVLAGHIKDSKYSEKLEKCKIRLGLSSDAKQIDIYNKLITKLIEMYKSLIKYDL